MDVKSMDNTKTYLVTGAAGFIGFYLSKKLLSLGHRVIGIDNLNEYYDVNLKNTRLDMLKPYERFEFVKGDIAEKAAVMDAFRLHRPDMVANLAAQAGVRYSIENPDAYIDSNIIGFYNILEACRKYPVGHLVYASSSSVYGANKKVPFEETDFVDNPISLYAATKKSNELMAYTYSHLYKIPATGLRFFTVYGPMGRPDMAYFKFADLHFSDKPIRVFNDGDMENDLYRDFTYVDDIVEGITRILQAPSPDNGHRVFNIGNNKPEKLMVFIETLERALSKAAGREIVFEKIYEPIKPGDVPVTYASIDALQEAIGFQPQTPIEEGLQKFADWYCGYYDIK